MIIDTCWRPFPWCCSEAPWFYNNPNHFDQIEYCLSDWRNYSDSFLHLPAGSSPRRSGGEDGCKPGSLNKLLLNCSSRWSLYLSLALCVDQYHSKRETVVSLAACKLLLWTNTIVIVMSQHHCGEDDYDARSQLEDVTYLTNPRSIIILIIDSKISHIWPPPRPNKANSTRSERDSTSHPTWPNVITEGHGP